MRIQMRVQIAIAAALWCATSAGAAVTGEIFGPGSESFPIAVVPL